MSFWRVMVCLWLSVSLALPIGAATTGELCGWIVDEAGLPMAGVSVVASSPSQIGGEQITQTNQEGFFQYPRLAAGEYRVVVARPGFVTHEVVDAPVRLDRRTELRVTLSIAEFDDQVTVTGETSVVDPTRVSVSQNFTADYLEKTSVGSDARVFWSSVSQAPGVTRIAGRAGVDPSVAGSSPEENTYLIDGLDMTDIVSGLVGTYLNFEAIDEISVQTAGFEAEYGRATGGVVNLVTKSGSNDLHLTVDSRYRDNSFETAGQFYDPDKQASSLFQTSVAGGGPIARDKAWCFGSAAYQASELTRYRSPTTEELRFDNLLAKVTWKPSSRWQLVAKYSGGAVQIDNFGSDQFQSPEATFHFEQLDDLFQVEVSGVLGDELLWSGQIGRNTRVERGLPQSGDVTRPMHFNLATNRLTGNSGWRSSHDRTRDLVRADLTWLVEDLGGRHELKTGFELHDLEMVAAECSTGDPFGRGCTRGAAGYQFLDVTDSLGGSPFLMAVNIAIGDLRSAGELNSAFVQDSWRLLPELTLQLGLRWDGVSYENSFGSRVADLGTLQPRVGVAWDLRGRGRQILRASWGRFMHPGTVFFPYVSSETIPLERWLSCSWAGLESGFDPAACSGVSASLGWGWGEDFWGWDPAGWMLDPAQILFASGSEIVEDLEASYADQLVLGFDQEIVPHSSLELSFVRKATRNGINDTCRGNVPDPVEGAACDFFVVANLPQIERDYEAWILRSESRFLEDVHLAGSYVYSVSKGSVWSTSAALEGTFDLYPYHFVNRYGYLPDHQRHRVKLDGHARLPLDFELGFSAWWSSPSRWTPQDSDVTAGWGAQYVEPRGSRGLEDTYQLDLQLSKGFEIGHTRLEAIGVIYNLFDSEQPIWVCEDVNGCGDYALGQATSWRQPRRYEVGLRIER